MNKRFEVYVTQSSFCASSPIGRGNASCSDDPINRYYEPITNLKYSRPKDIQISRNSLMQLQIPICSLHVFSIYIRNDMMGELQSCGIPCTVILDSAVGYIMGQVDSVMFGAEGVVESGGIINKVNLEQRIMHMLKILGNSILVKTVNPDLKRNFYFSLGRTRLRCAQKC